MLRGAPSTKDLAGMLECIDIARAAIANGDLEQGRDSITACKLLCGIWHRMYGSYPGILDIERNIGAAESLLSETRGRLGVCP